MSKKEQYKKKFEENKEKYKNHYDENKFLKIIRSIPRKIAEPFLRLYYVMKHPNIDTASKVFCVAALGYVVLPFDIIPDIMPIVGWIDDLAIVGGVLHKLNKWSHSEEVNEQVEKFYSGKKLSLLD